MAHLSNYGGKKPPKVQRAKATKSHKMPNGKIMKNSAMKKKKS